GYTTWSIDDVAVTPFEGEVATLTAQVTNTGVRAGKHVVQVYAARTESAVDRPVRWLVGFAVVRAEAGQQTVIEIPVRRRDLAYWDGAWIYETGSFQLCAGSSVDELGEAVRLDLA
ncbi:MAG: fibronectin type III-like domain-contianing protein, partial [Mycetocola sp.]